MNNLILAAILAFLLAGTDFNRQNPPPLLDNRLFKPARVVDSKKTQALVFSIYKKIKLACLIKENV